MISSIFSSSPLCLDLARQPRQVARAAAKLLLLAAILFAADWALHRFLLGGLNQYYGLDRPVAVACIGNSRTVLGIDGELMAERLGVPVAKYAVEGANAGDRFAMIRHLVSRQRQTLHTVVYDVSAYSFDDSGLSSNSYQLFFPFLDEPEMGDYVRTCCTAQDRWWLRRLFRATRYSEVTLSLAVRGHLGVHDNFKRNQLDAEWVKRRIQKGRIQNMHVRSDAYQTFDETMQYLRRHGIQVVLVYIPTVDLLNDVDRAAHDDVVGLLQQYARTHDGLTFLDYNAEYQTRHDLFMDGIHMNARGQELVSGRLADDLKQAVAAASLARRTAPDGKRL